MAARFYHGQKMESVTLCCLSCGQQIPDVVPVKDGAVMEALSWHYGAMRKRYEGSGHCTFAVTYAQHYGDPNPDTLGNQRN